MNRNDTICSIDLRACGRGCESNPHNCPCALPKEKEEHGHIVCYGSNGRSPVRIPVRRDNNFKKNQ